MDLSAFIVISKSPSWEQCTVLKQAGPGINLTSKDPSFYPRCFSCFCSQGAGLTAAIITTPERLRTTISSRLQLSLTAGTHLGQSCTEPPPPPVPGTPAGRHLPRGQSGAAPGAGAELGPSPAPPAAAERLRPAPARPRPRPGPACPQQPRSARRGPCRYGGGEEVHQAAQQAGHGRRAAAERVGGGAQLFRPGE